MNKSNNDSERLGRDMVDDENLYVVRPCRKCEESRWSEEGFVKENNEFWCSFCLLVAIGNEMRAIVRKIEEDESKWKQE